MVTDGALVNIVLGRTLSLDKALEPDLSDELLSSGGHRTMFSAGGSSPEVIVESPDTSYACTSEMHKNSHEEAMDPCLQCLLRSH